MSYPIENGFIREFFYVGQQVMCCADCVGNGLRRSRFDFQKGKIYKVISYDNRFRNLTLTATGAEVVVVAENHFSPLKLNEYYVYKESYNVSETRHKLLMDYHYAEVVKIDQDQVLPF